MLNAKIAFRALRTRFVNHRPFILSHLLTSRCNADCQTCLWKVPATAAADELTTDQIVELYRTAAGAGFCLLVLWGGEPLLRKDCGQLLRAAREAGLKTTLITNGWWLEEQAEELMPWTDRLMVSIDAVGQKHDTIRRCPGLFERLDRGMQQVRRAYPKVFVIANVVLSRLNSDALEEIAEYSKEHANLLSFQGMNETDYGHAFRELDLAKVRLSPEEEDQIAERIAAMRRGGHRLSDSGAYLSRLGTVEGGYRCHFKKVSVRIEPNGDVLDCTKTAVPLANVRQTSLPEIINSPDYDDFVKRAESCNRCRDFAVVEVSNLWEGRGLWSAIKTLT